MKRFNLDSHMTALIGGAFYPTGHSMIMFPSLEVASRIGHKLIEDEVVSGDEIYLISPTEGNAVANYTRLAREGHAALLIKTRDEAAAEKVMAVVREAPYSTAERYRRLVIEDL
jgi:hypothetical protein